MRTLIWRLFKRAWVVQAAMVLLIASGVAVLAIYGAYMEREASALNDRVKTSPEGSSGTTAGGLFYVTDPVASPNRDLTVASFPLTFQFVAGWYNEVVPTTKGDLPVYFLDLTHGQSTLTLGSKVVAIHANIAHRLGLSVGDVLTIFGSGGEIRVRVSDVFSETPFYSGLDFGEGIVVFTGQAQDNTHFLYRRTSSYQTTGDAQLKNAISQWHSRGSSVSQFNEGSMMGDVLVKSNYAVISQARYTLLLFVGLAFLTAKLLGYLDNRKMLAILKALGLRRGEIAASLGAESLLAPLTGAILGASLSVLIISLANAAGHQMSISVSIIMIAMLSILPAVIPGILVPARLAQVSTVNELLFERPAAMFREQTDSLRKHLPALDPFIQQGVRFLRLEASEGNFEGFIFRKLGDKVQAGEVLAFQQSWWGMKTREYVAPIAGTIVYYEPYTGVIGIGSEELLVTTEDIAEPLRINFSTAGHGEQ